MKKVAMLVALFVFITLVAGCARLSVVRVAERGDTTTEGIRYYRPYPYLMVSQAKEGEGLEYKIIYLPDMGQEYAIQVRAGFGVVDFKPTLENGWNLIAVDAKVDSKTKEVMEAAAGLIEKGAKVAAGGRSPDKQVQPGIYRFIIDQRRTLADGNANPNYGKTVGVDFERPVADFKVQ
jgi:hypothetical protein